jgi:hypothetical protein
MRKEGAGFRVPGAGEKQVVFNPAPGTQHPAKFSVIIHHFDGAVKIVSPARVGGGSW